MRHIFSLFSLCSNREFTISKLEQLYEAETLSERDSFDIGADESTQEPAIKRLRQSIKKKRDCAHGKLDLPDPATTDNLATLPELSEPILLQYLQERYQKDQIYVSHRTYIHGVSYDLISFLTLCLTDLHW